MKVRLVTGNDALSWAIRTAEYGFWASHAEVLVGNGGPGPHDNGYLGAHANGGVMIRPVGYDRWTKQLLVDVPLVPSQEQAAIEFLIHQIGKPYDMLAIAAFVAGRDWRSPDHWFCSELVAASLEHCGWLQPLAADVNHVTPRDLLLILSSHVAVGQPETR